MIRIRERPPLHDLPFLHAAALHGAAFLNAAMPGPGFALAANRTTRRGVRSGLLVSLGVNLGMLAALICALCAMLGVLGLSRTLFDVTRWAGVVVLAALGLATLAPRRAGRARPVPPSAGYGDIVAGTLVGITNPALFVFLLALLPQFAGSGPGAALRVGLGGAAFLAGGVAGMLAAVAFGAASRRVGPDASRWLDLAAGTALLGFAALAVAAPAGS